MHRTNRVPPNAFWSVLLGLTFSGAVLAQPPAVPAPVPVAPVQPGAAAPQPGKGVLPVPLAAEKPIAATAGNQPIVVPVMAVCGSR